MPGVETPDTQMSQSQYRGLKTPGIFYAQGAMTNNSGFLVIFSGLPGTGKSTIARELARVLGGIHLRIDSIEQALRDSGRLKDELWDAGYRVAYAVAANNLN